VLQLLQKALTHFKVRSSRVNKLKCLDKTPSITAHNESCNYEASSILAPNRGYNDTFLFVDSFLHEAVDGLGDCFLFVVEYLLLVVLPVEREVVDAESLPLVFSFSAGAVDDARDFV
jgi:hypothetical protein